MSSHVDISSVKRGTGIISVCIWACLNRTQMDIFVEKASGIFIIKTIRLSALVTPSGTKTKLFTSSISRTAQTVLLWFPLHLPFYCPALITSRESCRYTQPTQKKGVLWNYEIVVGFYDSKCNDCHVSLYTYRVANLTFFSHTFHKVYWWLGNPSEATIRLL